MNRFTDYITVKAIVEDVIRKTDDHQGIDIYDAAEWVAQAMDKIGLRDAFDVTLYTVEIEDGRGELPYGINNILAVRDTTTGWRIFKSTDDFAKDPLTLSGIDEAKLLTYYIQGRYIFCNFDEGEIQILYTSYPLDEMGLPMIPGETHYKEAVVSYLIYMMDYRLWRKGRLPEKVKIDSEQEWYLNLKKARSVNSITIDDMENIVSSMVKIASDRYANFSSFKYLGTPNINNY